MRSFWIFLAGMLATTILVGVGGYIFTRPSNTEQGSLLNDVSLIPPADRFTISATIDAPPALKEVVKTGKGRLTVNLLSGPQGSPVLPLVLNLAHPTFPYHLQVTLSKKNLAKNSLIKSGVTVAIVYNPSDVVPEPWSSIYFEPTVLGGATLPFTEQQISAQQLPSTYEVGTIGFSRYYPYLASAPCLSDKVTLAGKITPTPEFLQKFGKDRFALVLYEETIRGRSGQSPERENEIAYSQLINFSSGPVSFSIPPMKNNFPYFALLAQRCENGEELQACAHRAVPIRQFDQKKNRFVVNSARNIVPFCGMADYDGVIDKSTYELQYGDGKGR